MSFKTIWFQDAKREDHAQIKTMVEGSQKTLDILVRILYNKVRGLETVSTTDYDSPSWSHKQAHINGKREQLLELIRICNLDDTHDSKPDK